MNKINKLVSISILSLTFSSATFALTEGPYIGAGVGGSILNDLNHASKKNDDPQLAGRVFAGFNFNSWLGLELSYARYGNTEYTLDKSLDSVKYDYKLDAVSLVGKAYLPLDTDAKLSLYGLAGVTYLNANADTKFVDADISSESTHIYAPTAGAGFQYAVNKHLTTSLEYTYATGKNGDSDHLGIPKSNLLTFNIAVVL